MVLNILREWKVKNTSQIWGDEKKLKTILIQNRNEEPEDFLLIQKEYVRERKSRVKRDTVGD